MSQIFSLREEQTVFKREICQDRLCKVSELQFCLSFRDQVLKQLDARLSNTDFFLLKVLLLSLCQGMDHEQPLQTGHVDINDLFESPPSSSASYPSLFYTYMSDYASSFSIVSLVLIELKGILETNRAPFPIWESFSTMTACCGLPTTCCCIRQLLN